MGHVAGVSTETQTRVYVHYAAMADAEVAKALANPSTLEWDDLTAVVTAATHLPITTEIGDMGGTPDIRTFTVFGEKRKRKVAGPEEPADFEFGITLDRSEAAHVMLGTKRAGDLVTLAIVTYDADEDTFVGDDGPDNVDAVVASGVITHVREVNAAGSQKMLMAGCAWSAFSPVFVTN